MSLKDGLVDRARKSKFIKYIYLKVFSPYVDLHVKELSLKFDLRPSNNQKTRLNLLLPSISREHVFGGITTAISYFNQIAEEGGFQKRIIVINAEPRNQDMDKKFLDYQLVGCEEDSSAEMQILPCQKGELSIPVGRDDLFFATAWWTAYCAQKIVDWQSADYRSEPKKIIYFIQDYEPGFYPWSSEYLISESTYKYRGPQIALYNTKLLQEFFNQNGYKFEHEFYFEPALNETMMQYKNELNLSNKKKQILIYGRPSTPRNAFSLIMESLKVWSKLQPNADQWKVVSVGEKHRDIDVGNGVTVVSRGKLDLKEYAKLLAESTVGISLMVSPHPSYPPFEMAEYGLHVITNRFQSKDLSKYYTNIISLQRCMPDDIAEALLQAIQKPQLNKKAINLMKRNESGGHSMIADIVKALEI